MSKDDNNKDDELGQPIELFSSGIDKEILKEIEKFYKARRPLQEIYADQPEELAKLLEIAQEKVILSAIVEKIKAGSTLSQILVELKHRLSPEEIWAAYEIAFFPNLLKTAEEDAQVHCPPELLDKVFKDLEEHWDDDPDSE